MPTKEDKSPSGSRQALEAVVNEWRLSFTEEIRSRGKRADNYAGFELARFVQGAFMRRGADIRSQCPKNVAVVLLEMLRDDCAGLQPEAVFEEMLDLWPKVKVPKGSHPLNAARDRARLGQAPAPGDDYQTPLQKQYATQIWHLLLNLPPAPEAADRVYITERKLAELLEMDIDAVRRAVKALVRNKVIEVAEKGYRNHATRYKIQQFP